MIEDHEFVPSSNYPNGQDCAYIVAGHTWTINDPIRCRHLKSEHLKINKQTGQQEKP